MKFERRTLRLAALCGAAGIVGAGAAPSRAVEALDGDLQLHGELEIQTRVLASDYDASDGFHLGQWWNILNLELEYDVAPEGWGPFDLISTYTRAEVRYDCVWTGGCYMLPNYRERYGNDATRLPRRLSDGHRSGLIGSIDPDEFSDKRNAIKVPLAERSAPYGAPAGLGQSAPNTRHVGRLWNDPVLGQLFFAGAGPDRIWGEDLAGFVDDSGFYVASDVLDYRFGFKKLPGAVGGNATQTLGPWRPEDKIPARGILRDRANPLRGPDLFVPHSAGRVVTNGAMGGVSTVDVSIRLIDDMLDVSRALNPECEHVQGDMRTLRLGRTFDAVLVHDAIDYMTTEEDLRRAMETAFVHTRPGGAALFAPDFVRETFRPSTDHGGEDGDGRALRWLEWVWDPDPSDLTYAVEYVLALREGEGEVRIEHDHHLEGLFPRALWMGALAETGYRPVLLPFRHSDREAPLDVFVGTRPR